MLNYANGNIEKAEEIAKYLIQNQGQEYLFDLGLLYSVQGKFKESFEIMKKTEELFPNNDKVKYNKGWHEMLQGNLLEGFKLMNEGRKIGLWGNKITSHKPIWNYQENLKNKYLLFNCEAGFGDQIIFSRFIKDFKEMGAKIILSCSKEIVPYFSQYQEASCVIQQEAIPGVYHDYFMPSMLAPVILEKEYSDLNGKPYLFAKEEYIKKFKKIIGDSKKFKIGIRWLGRDGDDYINRIFPEELLFNSVNNENFEIFSLQKDLKNNNSIPKWINDLDVYLDTWDDTAGAIENMDLVITSCTSVAHISASMGKPTWIIIPMMMYYIWSWPLNETSPWYDSVTLFRQEKYGSWEEPFNKIKNKLNEFLKGK